MSCQRRFLKHYKAISPRKPMGVLMRTAWTQSRSRSSQLYALMTASVTSSSKTWLTPLAVSLRATRIRLRSSLFGAQTSCQGCSEDKAPLASEFALGRFHSRRRFATPHPHCSKTTLICRKVSYGVERLHGAD